MIALLSTTAALLLALDPPPPPPMDASPEQPHPMDISADGASNDDAPFGGESSRPPAPILLRFGADGAGGYFTAGDIDFDLNLRLGAQLLRNLGVYADLGYVAGAGFGGSFSGSGGSISASGVGYFHGGILAEGDFGSLFIAGGPMIAYGGFGEAAEGEDVKGDVTQYAVSANGWMPGFDLRAGFNFGSERPSTRRSGFTLGVEMMGVFASATSVGQSTSGASISQGVQTGSTIFAATPLLFLGFETW